jgi:hypothetical protein
MMNEEVIFEGTEAELERLLIDQYLHSQGYAMADLCKLSEDKHKQLMIEACRYATAKLADIESRDKFKKEIHYLT